MSASAHSRRLARFFLELDGLGLDGAVVDGRDDIFYLTGFTGSDSLLALAAKTRRSWLVTDRRYLEEGRASAPGSETVVWRGAAAGTAAALLRRLGRRRLGYTPESIRAAVFDKLRAAAPGVEFCDVGPEIAGLRAVKDAEEIGALARALACAESAFQASRKRWRPGLAEIEVKNDLEWEMRRLGAEDAAFETIVATGSNSSLPHAHAGRRKIRPGKMLLVDFGARVGRYNSDLTRTLWAGEMPKAWRRRCQALLDASLAGRQAIRPGVSGRIPHLAACASLAASGLVEHFTHGLGHGVGLAIHEKPNLSPAADGVLQAGNVVTVEPGVYWPGRGGVRLEDMVLVVPGGCRLLSSLPRDADDLVF
ncbi:MAG: Xaa-Pro peptidase family protein [Planctomycetota bacterium]|jgi:Xaa-Pro aminopeptidase/Xaa-Pro dipeptidase|nr:Xaa-Pro peptidase family protein [Planctomycetota bacterium]